MVDINLTPKANDNVGISGLDSKGVLSGYREEYTRILLFTKDCRSTY